MTKFQLNLKCFYAIANRLECICTVQSAVISLAVFQLGLGTVLTPTAYFPGTILFLELLRWVVFIPHANCLQSS